eukprot:CAMPEP_0170555354 /NCGR_PEP_ID=MMETSP0211-20121228/13258_1 /TAXON_ID=311385 /ORGANISM="Pseudokeronopsis sp., Strain OXSARD2" /LENGTH=66 /DNA_ID=CAMNT_0010865141 /DNA_START=550 /DNA_END=746 /DNA_ORIENTATION=-
MLELEEFVMFYWTSDTQIYPKWSSIFSSFNQNGDIVPLEENETYVNDVLGLKELNEAGKIKMISLP